MGLGTAEAATQAARQPIWGAERRTRAERQAAERQAAASKKKSVERLGPNHLFRYKPTDAYLKIDTNINGIFGNLINYLSKNDVKIVEQQLNLIRMLKEAKYKETLKEYEEAEDAADDEDAAQGAAAQGAADEVSTMDQVD
jgi:hypothetical protein